MLLIQRFAFHFYWTNQQGHDMWGQHRKGSWILLGNEMYVYVLLSRLFFQDLRAKNWKAMEALEKSEKSSAEKVDKALKAARVNIPMPFGLKI